MKQFQVKRTGLTNAKVISNDQAAPNIVDGEISLRIERFGFSANNITYGIAGDTLGYWKFFKQLGVENTDWGILPVWGFAEVVESKTDGIEVGERLFGYFPPATHLVMQPVGIKEHILFDGCAHRAELPGGYNMYRRVNAEPGYNRDGDNLRMLLYPLYLTSFAIWDQLKEMSWYGAEQVLIISASAKTSIGLATALHDDKEAPKAVGLTSAGNADFVSGLSLYDEVVSYDQMVKDVKQVPTVIVDMAGNAETLGMLHEHLGANIKKNIDVGITDWRGFGKDKRINRDSREFFFAPARIQKRMKDWGADEFNKRSMDFIISASLASAKWLNLETLHGLDALETIFPDIRDGKISPDRGLIIEM